MQAPDEPTQIFRRDRAQGLVCHGWNRGEGIFNSMFHFFDNEGLLFLSVLSDRYIPGDLRYADHPAGHILDRRYRQRNIRNTAILAHAPGVEVIDMLTAPDTSKNIEFLAKAIGRKQHCDGLAYRVLRRMAKQALGAGIPTGNDAAEVLADYGIVRRRDDGREPLHRLVGACLQAGGTPGSLE